jgi:glycine betaine catabolism B
MSTERYRVSFRMKAACDRVTGFRFDRPPGHDFRAGQYFRLTLQTRDGEQTKSFSYSNAPGDPFIEMATRLSGSAFKDALAALDRGGEVEVSGPFGKLIVPEGVEHLCILCGGVGITPARSIIRDAEQRRTGLRVRLLYGNHDQACIPYSGEFAEYERKDRRFHIVHVLEDPLPGWTGERGVITADLVRERVNLGERPWHFMVTGPPMMVQVMQQILGELEIPEDRVMIENFAGY